MLAAKTHVPGLDSIPACPCCGGNLAVCGDERLCDACEWQESDGLPIRPVPAIFGDRIKRFPMKHEAAAAAARVVGFDARVEYGWNGFWHVQLHRAGREVGCLTESDVARTDNPATPE